MHEREGARLGFDYVYRLVDFDQLGLDDAKLGAVIAAAEELGFSGLNVTHPFKQSVVSFLSELAPDAAAIGAVNELNSSQARFKLRSQLRMRRQQLVPRRRPPGMEIGYDLELDRRRHGQVR